MAGKQATQRYRHRRYIERRIEILEGRLANWTVGDPTRTREEISALQWALELMQEDAVERTQEAKAAAAAQRWNHDAIIRQLRAVFQDENGPLIPRRVLAEVARLRGEVDRLERKHTRREEPPLLSQIQGTSDRS